MTSLEQYRALAESRLNKLLGDSCCTPKGSKYGEHEYSVCACAAEDLAKELGDAIERLAQALEKCREQRRENSFDESYERQCDEEIGKILRGEI